MLILQTISKMLSTQRVHVVYGRNESQWFMVHEYNFMQHIQPFCTVCGKPYCGSISGGASTHQAGSTEYTSQLEIGLYSSKIHQQRESGDLLLHFLTNCRVMHQNITRILITPEIVKQVHDMATNQSMPTGVKMTNQTERILFDSTYRAGVDFDDEDFVDEDYKEDSEDEEEKPDELPWDEYFNEDNHSFHGRQSAVLQSVF